MEHFRTPDKVLWWFLAAAMSPVNALARTLESLTRAYGEHYRSTNRDLFCAAALWEVKYSPEAIAAKRNAAGPTKRQRPPSEESVAGKPPPQVPSGRSIRRKRARQRRLEAKSTEQDKVKEDRNADARPDPSQPADQRNAAAGATGGRGGGAPGGRGQRYGGRGGRGNRDGNRWRRG